MSALSLSAVKKARNPNERIFTDAKQISDCSSRVIAALKATWPTKTAAHVAYLSGVSERAVHFWLAGQTRMPMEAIASLLRTDAGYEILKAVIGDDCKVEWWEAAQIAHSIRQTRQAIKKEQDRIAATAARIALLDR